MLGKRLKKVSFATQDAVSEIPHIHDLPEDEIRALYISRYELQQIRNGCQTYVCMIDEGRHLDVLTGKELICTRGLEYHTKYQTSQAEAARDNIYDAVDALQHFRKASGKDVTEAIAMLCRRLSLRSVEQAVVTAIADASFVKKRRKHKSMNKKTQPCPFHKKWPTVVLSSQSYVEHRITPTLYGDGATRSLEDAVDKAWHILTVDV